MVSILDAARERGPFAGEGGRTAATFEHAVLRDGTPVVVKHVSSHDLFPKLVGESDRPLRLWRSGVFDRLPPVIDHTMLAVEPGEDGCTIVMRDISEFDLGDARTLTREENRRVLSALHAMHEGFWGEEFDGGCSLDERYCAFTRIAETGWHLAPVWKRGWELFPDLVPRDVSEAILKLVEAPELLVAEMARARQTFIHGDLRLHNMGIASDRILLYDWEIAGAGPPASEFAWYLIISASRIDATREQFIEDYRAIAGDGFDPRAWDLACLGAIVILGWNKAIDIVDGTAPDHRARERADLDWWVTRAREALETWSPV